MSSGTGGGLAIGDVVEVATPAGLAHVQFSHRHPSYPEVIRAHAGPLAERPADLAAAAAGPARFVALFPLASALSSGRLPGEVIGNVPLPPEARAFPTFRLAIRDKAGAVAYWWLWDGKSLSHTVELSADQRALPLREVLSAARLIERLAGDEAG